MCYVWIFNKVIEFAKDARSFGVFYLLQIFRSPNCAKVYFGRVVFSRCHHFSGPLTGVNCLVVVVVERVTGVFVWESSGECLNFVRFYIRICNSTSEW